MSTTKQKQTGPEVVKSLSGFDELAIAKQFGAQFDDLPGSMSTRALIFILKRRDGVEDPEAFEQAMNVTLGELDDHFAKGEEEATPEEPETESGKEPS